MIHQVSLGINQVKYMCLKLFVIITEFGVVCENSVVLCGCETWQANKTLWEL